MAKILASNASIDVSISRKSASIILSLKKNVWLKKINTYILCAESPSSQAKGQEVRGQKMPLPDLDLVEILIWKNNPGSSILTDRTVLKKEWGSEKQNMSNGSHTTDRQKGEITERNEGMQCKVKARIQYCASKILNWIIDSNFISVHFGPWNKQWLWYLTWPMYLLHV